MKTIETIGGDYSCENIVTQKVEQKAFVSRAISPAISQATANDREKPKTEINANKSCNQSGNQSRSKKADCYTCIYRGNIPGNAHSKCNHPKVKELVNDPLMEIMGLMGGGRMGNLSSLFSGAYLLCGIKGKEHGIKNGWFNWPINFDPVWLESCDGYTEKQ